MLLPYIKDSWKHFVYENGIKYYSVQVACDNGIRYGIQAYGDEAENLYKEVYNCAEHGKAANEKEKLMEVNERIYGNVIS